MYVAMVVVLAVLLAFHYAYCLVPSLRYFRARRAAYAVGLVAYAVVGLPPLVDVLLGSDMARTPAYYVASFAILTIIAWRPYAFVRASGGPDLPVDEG